MSFLSSEALGPAALGLFFLFASYLNLNDPDWGLWSTAYALGAAVCGWSALQGAAGTGGDEGAAMQEGAAMDGASRTRRSVARTYGAACLGLAAYSAFLAPRGEPVKNGGYDHRMIMAFLSSEIAREAGGALIMAQAMALCAFYWRPGKATAAVAATTSRTLVGAMSVAVALVAIGLGMYLPGYLHRAGITVAAHCGGNEED